MFYFLKLYLVKVGAFAW